MSASRDQSNARRDRTALRAHSLLLGGAVTGIAIAAAGVLRSPVATLNPHPETVPKAISAESLPVGAVARVNDRFISIEDFRQVLAMEVENGMVQDDATKLKLLDRMIDEELRVQRAIELNLHLTDSRVRMDLAAAVADAATAGAEQGSLDEETLRAYFEKRREYFSRRGPLRVRQIWVGIVAGDLGEAFNRARAATKLLKEKMGFETVQRICGSSEPRPIPDSFILPAELAGLLDPVALNTALTMQPNEVSDPIRTADGFHVLQVLERGENDTPNFEASRLDVEAEFWSDHAKQALESDAAELRRTAKIQKSRVL